MLGGPVEIALLHCVSSYPAPVGDSNLRTITDMSRRERWIFAPLVAMTLLLGVYPALVLDMIGPSVAALVDSYDTALEAAGAAVQTASE